MAKQSPLDPPQMELTLGERRFVLLPAGPEANKVPSHRVPTKLLLRIDEAAELLNISADQVRNFILEGKLRGKKISAQDNPKRCHVRVLTQSVAEFLESEETDA